MLAKDSRHHRHRLSRRRQDHADPPSDRQRRRPAPGADHQRIRRRRRRRRDSEGLRRRRLPERCDHRTRQWLHLLHRRRRIRARGRRRCSRATRKPDHIVIETSGLALPKPLVKAFDWPELRTRLTVDGVIAVVDAAAVAEGRFADDPARDRRAARAPTRRSITTIRSRKSTRTSFSAPTSWCSTRPISSTPEALEQLARRNRRAPCRARSRSPRPARASSTPTCCSASGPRPRTTLRPGPRITTRRASTTTTISTRSSWRSRRRATPMR